MILTFVHFFSHLASSALVVNVAQGISLSICPHRQRTKVVKGQGGQAPSWQRFWHSCGLLGWPHLSLLLQICNNDRNERALLYLLTA